MTVREPTDDEMFPDYDKLEEEALAEHDRDRPRGAGDVLVFRNPSGEPVAVPDEVVTEAERAYRCYKARLGGKSWEQIAIEEQYPSPKAAAADVERYMAEARSLIVESSQKKMLEMEVARLDALQSAIWPQAIAGNIPSATFVLNTIKLRAQLFAEMGGTKVDDGARTVVVVSKDSPSYIEELQRAAAAAEEG